MIAGNLAIKYGFQGPNIAITTACTTSTHCIGFGARMIAYGDADIVIAGGAEKASTQLGIAGFSAARALSTRNDAPKRQVALGIKTGTVLYWPMEQRPWCLKTISRRKRVELTS